MRWGAPRICCSGKQTLARGKVECRLSCKDVALRLLIETQQLLHTARNIPGRRTLLVYLRDTMFTTLSWPGRANEGTVLKFQYIFIHSNLCQNPFL